MRVIECSNLTKTFFTKKALNKLSFSIEENKITGLIGRNGAGKTTLLKIIAGFIKETSGEIKVFSEKPFNNLNNSAHVIYVDDHMSFPSTIPLLELLKVAESFYPNWNRDLAMRLFEYFSFDPKTYHHRLSKGKTSTFNMIIGLASRCSLTIFDEPTTGMDESVRKDFYKALLKDYIAYPRSIILSSHHLSEIEDLLEDVLLIKDGKTYLQMPISELKEYAFALQGNNGEVFKLTSDKEVIFKNHIASNVTYVIVKNDGSKNLLQQARHAGVEISPVPLSDLCVYLTNETNGGIEDVFNEN
ncbi:ATP-binding cassette domain-containing protein [Chengkuizengella marina]|uniref:ABC transporter ATP-binding protein n=1 Tax=Chengkuizengella marina TaxID=2507566 RepID=A0A6N9PYF6_9BACL|nr:ABC transporter ATP-binding protein [Chengkuizengella marina]NBI28549.1 ABC transporter ATP-binding protein [Chengkuizengella marina]